jgi:HNH endonuclease
MSINDGTEITNRIDLRYIRIPRPLWMGGRHDNVIASLSVSRARGGTVFNLTEKQWESVASLAAITDAEEAVSDIEQLRRRKGLSRTQRKALIQAQLGQGRFRGDLLKYWGGCAVVGCTVEAALRASHIKPWHQSSDSERLDPANGLLLVANLDALFNDGLITFDNDGQMLLSNELTQKDRSLLRLKGRLKKKPSARQRKYLRFHRNAEFHQ